MSLIHLMTRWLVQTTGSRSRFSHWARRACIICRDVMKKANWSVYFTISSTLLAYFQSECEYAKKIASLSKLSICRSWMADRMLVTWNLFVMLKMVSRSLRVIEFSTLPSTNWLWKTCEYWGSPTSPSQVWDTQWWSISAALESLSDKNETQNQCQSIRVCVCAL